MTELETIDLNFDVVGATVYQPDQQCYEWSLEQSITSYLNIETYTVMFVGVALLFLFAHEFCVMHPKLSKHAPYMVYSAKIMIYIFFFLYLVVIKMRLYYYITT